MFRRIFAAALGAGIGVGVLISALHHVGLVPTILEAEKYEKGTVAPHHEHGAISTDIGAHGRGLAACHRRPRRMITRPTRGMVAEENSPWRAVFTFIATTATGVGFALLLVGAYAVSGRPVDAREGLLWGLAGFAAFALAPAFGLPPELPGSVAADLVARQAWWIGTAVAATLAGIGLLVFMPRPWAIALAIVLLVAPHLVGAPHPHEGAGLVPPELAAAFAARSLGMNAVMWALLGLATGALYTRFGRSSTA